MAVAWNSEPNQPSPLRLFCLGIYYSYRKWTENAASALCHLLSHLSFPITLSSSSYPGAFAQAGSSYLEDDPWDLTWLAPDSFKSLLKCYPPSETYTQKRCNPTSISLLFWAYLCVYSMWRGDCRSCVLLFTAFTPSYNRRLIWTTVCSGQSRIPLPMIHRDCRELEESSQP